MPQYKYKAQTIDGKKISGFMNVENESELQLRLHEQDAFLLAAKEQKRQRAVQQFKPKVLSEFCRQLATLIAAGVTLVRALNIILMGEAVKPKERAVYEDMLRRIRQGISLSEAMEAQNGVFPPLLIYMFRSAETSGNLDKVALQMAILYEKDHRLNSKISSSMVYPKILAVLIVGVVIVLTKFVIPQFEEIFSQMGELPIATRILLGISDFMDKYWFIVIAAVIGIWLGIRALLRVPSVRLKWHRLKLRVPIFGKLQKVICTARFARTLSSLYAAGVPIVTGLQISRKTIGNDYIDSQFDDMISFVRAGHNLSDGLDNINGFVRKLSDSIRVGEETGSLDSMLLSTSEAMEYDSDVAINKMVSYVEPVMMIGMGLVVGFVMVAIFGALYGSYDAIGGM